MKNQNLYWAKYSGWGEFEILNQKQYEALGRNRLPGAYESFSFLSLAKLHIQKRLLREIKHVKKGLKKLKTIKKEKQ